MRRGVISLPVLRCVAVAAALSGAVASAAPPTVGIGSRTALATHLTDELKARAAALPDPWLRDMYLSSAAPYDHLLGRKEEFVRFQEKREAEAAAIAEPERRLRALRNVALYWSVVEPDRARRLLVRLESEIDALPAEKRGATRHDLSVVYFELDDYDKAIACAELRVYPESPGGVNSFSTLFHFRRMARYCLDHRLAEPLERLRNKIRKFEPHPEALDPQWKIDPDAERDRVDALAAAGLPEEAAALYEFCWSTGISYFNGPSGLAGIARAYAREGKRDAAKAFVRKHVSHIRPERKYEVATAAAHAGDYPLVDELLATAAPKEFLVELRSVIVAAHRRGDLKQCNELFDRYRDASSRAPKGASTEEDRNLACATMSLEAVMGRYDSALAMLPKLEGEQACELRLRLIDLLLFEQGKTFGRTAVSYTRLTLGDDDY